MALQRSVIGFTLLAGASAVTPIEKVISLVEGLRDEVVSDGKKEAKAYDKFACFCRDTTLRKSKSVKKGNDSINRLSANIADKTQERKEDITELGERKAKQEGLSQKLDETIARCAKEKAEYEAEAADLSKAIQGLKDAIKSMADSKPASLLELSDSVRSTIELAETMNMLKTAKHKKIAAFVQQSSKVDPNDPEYKFHSDDIIDLCKSLLNDYKGNKKDLDDEWSKTDKGCKETKSSLKKSMSANDDAMKQLKKDIERLKEEIAEHRGDLVTADGQLKDDDLYLKDLQARCEDRAHDYDQRSAMRGDELAALEGALKVLKKDVKGRADDVNERAFIQKASEASKPVAVAPAAKVESKTELKAISFLQGSSESAHTREALKQSALDYLRKEGQHLNSLTVLSLAERMAADPFKKVKGLIQKLIERLITEAKNEATKKGFCDTELAKARKDRDFRYQEATDLSADLAGLEAKRDSLKEEIKQLTKDIKEESFALKEATEDRKDEKSANMQTMKTAKEGLEAVNEALLILRSFYKQAAKAAFVQASPVDEDTSGPGFSGNYKGKQGGAQAVFALLETIASDFDRTLRKTDEAENASHRDFVEYSQAAKSSIAGKTTKKELDDEDLKTTLTGIKTKTDDMQTAVDLLDGALQELEELKPTCIDTGMSYAERVKKREEEIKALQNALRILAPP